MKTKEQVIEFVATELKNGNSVVMATLSNGGSGLTLLPEGIDIVNKDKGIE